MSARSLSSTPLFRTACSLRLLPLLLFLLAACTTKSDIDIGDAFPGLDTALGDGSAVRVLIVHGIGCHDPGYSHVLQDRLIGHLGFPSATAETTAIRMFPDHASKVGQGAGAEEVMQSGRCFAAADTLEDQTLEDQSPALVVRRFKRPDGASLAFYEVTWSPLSSRLKNDLLGYDSTKATRRKRALYNDSIKEGIVNQRFSDVVYYLGAGGTQIRQAVRRALCRMWRGPTLVPSEPCLISPDTARETAAAMDDSRFAVITFSLGSKVVFDTIQEVSKNEALRAVSAKMISRTDGFYMLANQLPLLALSQPPPVDILEGRQNDPVAAAFAVFRTQIKRALDEPVPEQARAQLAALATSIEDTERQVLDDLYRDSARQRADDAVNQQTLLQRELVALDKKEAELDRKLVAAQVLFKEHDRNAKAADADRHSLNRQRKRIRDQATVLDGEISGFKKNIAALRRARIAIKRDITATKRAADDLEDKVDDLEDDIEELADERKDLADKVKNLQAGLERRKRDDTFWWEDIADILGDPFGNLSEEEKVAQIEANIESTSADLDGLTARTKFVAAQRAAAERDADRKRKEAVALEQRGTAIAQDVDEKNAARGLLGERKAGLDAQFGALGDQAVEARNRYKEKRQERAGSEQDIRDFKDHLGQVGAGIDQNALAQEEARRAQVQAEEEAGIQTVTDLSAFSRLFNEAQIRIYREMIDLIQNALTTDGLKDREGDPLGRLRETVLRKLDGLSLAVVALNDPNDPLSYPIPESFGGGIGDMDFVNVEVSLTPEILWVYANPVRAHTGHMDNTSVVQMIACGAEHKSASVIVRACGSASE